MISALVGVDSLLLALEMERNNVFTSNFVHRAADIAPVIGAIATSARYPIATSGLAHTVSKKPQDKHWPR